MSKAISLKLNDGVFQEAESIVKSMHIPRNSYINQAIKYYNYLIKRKMLKKQYIKESAITAKHSLEVNRELQEIDDEILGL